MIKGIKILIISLILIMGLNISNNTYADSDNTYDTTDEQNINKDYLLMIDNVYHNYLNFNNTYIESIEKIKIIEYEIDNLENDNKIILDYIMKLKQYVVKVKDKINITEKTKEFVKAELYLKLNTKVSLLLEGYDVEQLNYLKVIFNKTLNNLTNEDPKNLLKILKVQVLIKIISENIEKRHNI